MIETVARLRIQIVAEKGIANETALVSPAILGRSDMVTPAPVPNLEAPVKIILACDESGAKGFADIDEAYDGEIGVFAGIVVAETISQAVESDFLAINQKYRPSTGKLHIADLAPEEQDALRAEVYAAVRKHDLPCFWYGIHVAGLHRDHVSKQQLFSAAQQLAAQASHQPGRYKGGSKRENPASLHVELFTGLYGHVIAYLEEQGIQAADVEVKTDRVDSPIVTKFCDMAHQLLSFAPQESNHTRFDTQTQTLVTGTIRMEIQLPQSLTIDVQVKSLALNVVDDRDGLVLGADVLANSLNYLFKHRSQGEKYGPLNCKAAIASHPLADNLSPFSDWGEGDIVGDRLYAHPKFNDTI